MRPGFLWYVAKGLEGIGMTIVLVGVLMSIQLGMNEEGLASMRYEGTALLVGGGLFFVGWLIERAVGDAEARAAAGSGQSGKNWYRMPATDPLGRAPVTGEVQWAE